MIPSPRGEPDDKQAVKIRMQRDTVKVLGIIARSRGVSFSKIAREALHEFAVANLNKLSPEEVKNAIDPNQ